MKTPIIFGFCNGKDYATGLYIGTAVTDNGEVIHSVLCRSEPEMAKGLGMDGKSRSMHGKYIEKYPNGFSTEFVNWRDTATHKGLKIAIALWRAAHKTLHGNGFITVEHQ